MSKVGIIFTAIGALVLFVAVGFGLTWSGIEWFRFFEPKREDARREVFEHTRSYVQAKVQELSKYRHEYKLAKDDDDKKAIASTIRHRFADFPREKLPPELQQFLKEIF